MLILNNMFIKNFFCDYTLYQGVAIHPQNSNKIENRFYPVYRPTIRIGVFAALLAGATLCAFFIPTLTIMMDVVLGLCTLAVLTLVLLPKRYFNAYHTLHREDILIDVSSAGQLDESTNFRFKNEIITSIIGYIGVLCAIATIAMVIAMYAHGLAPAANIIKMLTLASCCTVLLPVLPMGLCLIIAGVLNAIECCSCGNHSSATSSL
jgi:hypothetical protein